MDPNAAAFFAAKGLHDWGAKIKTEVETQIAADNEANEVIKATEGVGETETQIVGATEVIGATEVSGATQIASPSYCQVLHAAEIGEELAQASAYTMLLQETVDHQIANVGMQPELALKRRPFKGEIYVGGTVYKNVSLRIEVINNSLEISFVNLQNPLGSSHGRDYRKVSLHLQRCQFTVKVRERATAFQFTVTHGTPKVVVNPNAPANIPPSDFENWARNITDPCITGTWRADISNPIQTSYATTWGLKFWINEIYTSRHELYRHLRTCFAICANRLRAEAEHQIAQLKSHAVNARIGRNQHDASLYDLSFERPEGFRGNIAQAFSVLPDPDNAFGSGPVRSFDMNIGQPPSASWMCILAKVNPGSRTLTCLLLGACVQHQLPETCSVVVTPIMNSNEYAKAMLVRIQLYFKMMRRGGDIAAIKQQNGGINFSERSICTTHLNAVLALFKRLIEGSGAIELAGLSSSFYAIMNRLGPPSWIQSVQIPIAEQADFSFSSALLILDDMIASTVPQE